MLLEADIVPFLANDLDCPDFVLVLKGNSGAEASVDIKRSDQERELTAASQLEPGKYYHCFSREDGEHSIKKCSITLGYHFPFLGDGFPLADGNTNDALEKWRVFGPITPPNLDDKY